MASSLTYNTHFERFLLVGMSQAEDPRTGRAVTGVYFSLSSDLIHWSSRRLLLTGDRPETHTCDGPDPFLYPAILDPRSPSRNFDTTGQRTYLYFTRFNYTACRMTTDRDLVRIAVEFSR